MIISTEALHLCLLLILSICLQRSTLRLQWVVTQCRSGGWMRFMAWETQGWHIHAEAEKSIFKIMTLNYASDSGCQ